MVKKAQTAISFSTLWLARLALTILAFAGLMSFLGQVDPVIAYAVSGLLVAFLVKETL